MKKLSATILFIFLLSSSFAQQKRNYSVYLNAQYSKTIYDRTLGNNPWGMGLGLQGFFNKNKKVQLTVDLTADAYPADDKVLRIIDDGGEIEDVNGMVNLFAGASVQPGKSFYLSLVAGPSFISGQVLVGVKPSVGFYLSKNQRWTGKISYINIFDRGKRVQQDFGSVGITIGLKLF